MKMKISSIESHKRTHSYQFSQKELEQLALNKIATELGLDLKSVMVEAQSNVISVSHGINNPSSYECRIQIVEKLDCKD